MESGSCDREALLSPFLWRRHARRSLGDDKISWRSQRWKRGIPLFNDRKRLIWSVQSSPEECKEYTVSFQGEGGKAQLVFKKIYGEYEIRLNGTQIAAGKDHSTKHRDRDWSSCVLDVSLVKGENRLTVVCKSSTGRCGLHDGVYRRSTRRAVWSRSTFGGKCMLLVRSQQEPFMWKPLVKAWRAAMRSLG